MTDDEALARCAARLHREGYAAVDLAELTPVFDPLLLVDDGAVDALARGLRGALDDQTAAALTDAASGPAEVAARFFALRDRLAVLGALSAARARR